MRSSWPADRILRLLAEAGLEAAWLTLVYISVQWLSHTGRLDLGPAQLGAAAIAGMLLARTLGRGSLRLFLVGMLLAATVVGVLGVWLAVAPALSLASMDDAIHLNPGGWLLGVALLRGAAHAWSDGDTGRVERLLDLGLIWLAGFWALASLSGLATTEPYASSAYAASLALVTSGLIALGLSRLAELRVAEVDRAAPWRWPALVIGVTGLVLAIGLPLAAILGVPVSATLAGIAGPLTPVLLAIVFLVTIPLGLLAELLHLVLPPTTDTLFPDLRPILGPGSGTGQPESGVGLWSGSGMDWMLGPLLIGVAWLVVVGIILLLNRPTKTDELELDLEVRETEPIGDRLRVARLPRPHLAMRRPAAAAPRTASEAYPNALPLLVGRPEERRVGETPRAHARRIAPMELGRLVARLAADYQLTAFAQRSLTPAEERRALDRWRQVERTSRSGAARTRGRSRPDNPPRPADPPPTADTHRGDDPSHPG